MESTITVQQEGICVLCVYEVWLRPWTVNAERAGNRWERAKNTKLWREHFGRLNPNLTISNATVEVQLELKGRLQDTAACMPAVKAAIDGMVDANLFIDDTGDHVKAISFHAPVRQKENKITIIVKGEIYERGATSTISP
jgi:hypothetical protein